MDYHRLILVEVLVAYIAVVLYTAIIWNSHKNRNGSDALEFIFTSLVCYPLFLWELHREHRSDLDQVRESTPIFGLFWKIQHRRRHSRKE